MSCASATTPSSSISRIFPRCRYRASRDEVGEAGRHVEAVRERLGRLAQRRLDFARVRGRRLYL
jgi:hypothetical protein